MGKTLDSVHARRLSSHRRRLDLAAFCIQGMGEITRLNYAKRLFAVPIAVLGQATGQASMPFFAKLSERNACGVRDTVNGSIYRIVAASLLATVL